MGATDRAKQRVEAWVKAQQDEQQDQRMDQRQQLQQGGEQGKQQAQQVQQQPSPLSHLLRPEALERFRQVMYQELHMVIPQLEQQQPSPLDYLLRPEVQERFRQAMYQKLHMVIPQLQQQQAIQQTIQQAIQQAILQHQPQGQPQGEQPTYATRRQQQEQGQAHQQQVQQQQAQLPRQPQNQPHAQSNDNQEKGPTSFSTDRAHYVIIRRVADSSEGTVSLARSTPNDRSPSAGELRIVKSVPSNGSDPREAHMLFAAGPHPNVLRIFESAYEKRLGVAHMCMEYCSGGDLHELQCAYGAQLVHVPDQVILKAIADISDGLAFLHGGWVRDEKTGYYQTALNAGRIIHRDLVRNSERYPSIVVGMLIPYTENYEHLHKAQWRWKTPNIRFGRLWASIPCFGSRDSESRRDIWIPSAGV